MTNSSSLEAGLLFIVIVVMWHSAATMYVRAKASSPVTAFALAAASLITYSIVKVVVP